MSDNGIRNTLTTEDRLTVLLAREKRARQEAEVEKAKAQSLVLAQALANAQQQLAVATDDERAAYKKLQPEYNTDDATTYNLETGAITRPETEEEPDVSGETPTPPE